ncbi:MAG: putative glycoside hydrolase, partial [Anaerolineae bacterium]
MPQRLNAICTGLSKVTISIPGAPKLRFGRQSRALFLQYLALFSLISSCLLALALAWPALADPLPNPPSQRCRGGWESAVITPTHPYTQESRSTGYLKGLYITYYGMGSETHRARAQELLENTELNAIVMDVKGDFGVLPYTSTVQTALDIGAGNVPMIQDWAAWMDWFKARHIYTIARIVVFKDDMLSSAKPEWAVLDSVTGGVWHDGEGLGWVDPSREEVWDYNIALAVEAAQLGFDEIQFDYVRFPTDGKISRATFAVENTEDNRVAAISGFLARADEALSPYPVKLAADVFGYTTWREDDMGIGQKIEKLAPYLDVLSPML